MAEGYLVRTVVSIITVTVPNYLAGSVGLIMAVGCAHPKSQINGVIVPATEGCWLPHIDESEPSGVWTPTEDQIREAEPAIIAYIRESDAELHSRLQDYQCQYFGTIVDGRKRIYCNYFCDDWDDDIRTEIIVVDDGGDCYFQFEYDVESGACLGFSVNGEA